MHTCVTLFVNYTVSCYTILFQRICLVKFNSDRESYNSINSKESICKRLKTNSDYNTDNNSKPSNIICIRVTNQNGVC